MKKRIIPNQDKFFAILHCASIVMNTYFLIIQIIDEQFDEAIFYLILILISSYSSYRYYLTLPFEEYQLEDHLIE